MYRDTRGSFDEIDPASGNFGLYQRHQFVKSSKLTDMVGFLLNDALELDRYLINGVTLRLVLTRSKSEFSLMGNEGQIGYQIVIEDAFLRLVKQKINVGIIVAHSNLLKSLQPSIRLPKL
ncbi:uncharacterized protein LOC123524873 [Mercenaria mercenaria]|uniref:uncharacterized protein LOC123524873 n=1 Tax=Mercenaria mercenaria TaxID=6596 RepID=UPI001E1DA8E0|nr:uncharacterized protein LOC123524873 [Mercenaria mercenaria]